MCGSGRLWSATALPHPPSAESEGFEDGLSQLVLNVAGVEGGGGLEEEDVRLLLGDRPMLDAARDDQEFPLFQPDVAIAQLHAEAALHHQEHLVFVLMVVPDERPLELD